MRPQRRLNYTLVRIAAFGAFDAADPEKLRQRSGGSAQAKLLFVGHPLQMLRMCSVITRCQGFSSTDLPRRSVVLPTERSAGLNKGTLKVHWGYVSVRRRRSCDAGARFGTAQIQPKKIRISQGRLDMSRSKLALIAAMLLSAFVLYPQGASAAKFCAQLRGGTAVGHPDCSFSTLDACRARVKHRGGGHCYKLHA